MSTNLSEQPVATLTDEDLPVVPHWIGGGEYVSTSGRTAPVYDPALGIVTKRVALANKAEIDAAVASAKTAFEGWSDLSLARVSSPKSSPANTARCSPTLSARSAAARRSSSSRPVSRIT
jgi:hypothetical protein